MMLNRILPCTLVYLLSDFCPTIDQLIAFDLQLWLCFRSLEIVGLYGTRDLEVIVMGWLFLLIWVGFNLVIWCFW